jgi:hypothetical protein
MEVGKVTALNLAIIVVVILAFTAVLNLVIIAAVLLVSTPVELSRYDVWRRSGLNDRTAFG